MRRAGVAIACVLLLLVGPALAQFDGERYYKRLPVIVKQGGEGVTPTTTITPSATPTSTPSPTTTQVPIVGIVNGDFEQDSFGWAGVPANAVGFITSSPQAGVLAQSGLYVAQLGYAETAEIILEQEVVIPAAAPYLVYYRWITSTEPTCGDDLGGVVVHPIVDPSIIDRVDLCAATTMGGWERRTIDLRDYVGEEVLIQVATVSQIGDDLTDSAFAVDDITFSAAP